MTAPFPLAPLPLTRVRCADVAQGDTVRINAPLWYGQYGEVIYVGCDRVEVQFDNGAVISFLPHELAPADYREGRYA